MPEFPGQQSQLDPLWQAPVLISVILAGEGLAVVLTLATGIGETPLIHFGLLSLIVQWVALLTLGWLYLLRKPLRRVRPAHVAYIALALLVLASSLVSVCAWWVLRHFWSLPEGEWWALFVRFLGVSVTVGLLGLAAIQNHLRAQQLAVRAKQSELQALQARIRPHFLFNTLNTGAALVHERPEEAERLLLDLADLFRAALGGPRQIPLADELSLARRYLEIEGLRFGERLTVHWHLPRELPAVTVPALSIQPLVENAVRHGVERLPHGDVDVRVTTTPEHVIVRISNPLSPPDGTASTGHQVGLNASQVRIEAMTDGRGSVQTQVDNGRFIATVRLPVAH
ncbi:histidine kinase [Lysobacter sp. H23M47]|uniref:sensor histidine kinase n=1 Tax=Lysobacter sp. H23M47 TaxID=2781024 RepID=UPI00187EDF03|nr:histidine kinase [Lysobacter sp. H23M47]QOW25341.1 histidine kinase [Lysobacter sp. H23M47]